MSNSIWDTIATERRRLADELEHLTADQWSAQSPCEAWTVREVAAHLVMPFEIATPRFVFTFLKNRRDLDRTAIELTARVDRAKSIDDIVATLRANAENRWTPPGFGAEVPLGEIVVHGQDIRRALGLDHGLAEETIAMTLDGTEDPERRADYARRIGVELPSST